MACDLGIHNAITKILNNRPWFSYNFGDDVIRLRMNSDPYINKDNSMEVARELESTINDIVNSHFPDIGDIVTAEVDPEGWGYVKIHPTEEQLDYINKGEKVMREDKVVYEDVEEEMSEEGVEDNKLLTFYNSLDKESKKKLGTIDKLRFQYSQSSAFGIKMDEFLDMLKCRL